jgi:hypothetical protein
LCCLIAFIAQDAGSQAVNVPNSAFETGDSNPTSWTLTGGTGSWLDRGGSRGRRAISVTGSGSDSNAWNSDPFSLEASSLYITRFDVRSEGFTSGCLLTGPLFCNRDLSSADTNWEEQYSVFVTPRNLSESQSRLRFGQWQARGKAAFDNITLFRAQPVYASMDGVELGTGETINGLEYSFTAPFFSPSRNHSRPLVFYQGTFNTNRWVLGQDSVVVYRNEIAGKKQTEAEVYVAINYHIGGELVVEVGTDGSTWQEIGVLSTVDGVTFAVPANLLPASAVYLRLKARGTEASGKSNGAPSFQVGSYSYKATLDGSPMNLMGKTNFIVIEEADPRLKVTIKQLTGLLPSTPSLVEAEIDNLEETDLHFTPTIVVTGPDGKPDSTTSALVLQPGMQDVEIPFTIPGTGDSQIHISLGDTSTFKAETSVSIAELHNASYGERLSRPDDEVGLWWASSGWKVSQTRPVPAKPGTALTIRGARSEVEAAQLVLRPARPLKSLTASGSDLVGPTGMRIPADRVDVLRVRYVNIEQQTDQVGSVGPWPDPLPPITTPIDIAPHANQPLWVRVSIPKGIPGGIYNGHINLEAEGYVRRVPMQVEVFDFEMPQTMTCQSAFGFNPHRVFQYQNIQDPKARREVLDKYWENFAAHRISPYNPVPLDPLEVDWPALGQWGTGIRDREEKHSGESALLLHDTGTTAGLSCNYETRIPIPTEGLRLQFWYKTGKPDYATIVSFRHYDSQGKWMSGRNNDIRIEGTGDWQHFDRTITRFPDGSDTLTISLWATVYREDGSPTGKVWFDDLSLHNAGTGKAVIPFADFEPLSNHLEPVFRWDAWDKAMTRALDTYHFNTFQLGIPGLGGGTFVSRREPSMLGFAENTPEYKTAFKAYTWAIQEHLRERGWLEEAFVYWFDEPDPKDYAFVMNGFRKLEESGPDIRRMLTEQVEDALVGGPNLWCPVSNNYDHEDAELRRQKGDDFWWYVCTGPKEPYCTLFIDHPATELRVWLWQTWQRKISGILVWQSNYWTSDAAYPDSLQNPYEDPMGWTSGYFTESKARIPWGNGDGRFIYPPESAADGTQEETVLDGPVDSIRWEMLRDGIEDYEYFCILQALLREKGQKLRTGERKRMELLLNVPEAVSSDMTSFTKDPEPLERHRVDLAHAIEKLRAL